MLPHNKNSLFVNAVQVLPLRSGHHNILLPAELRWRGRHSTVLECILKLLFTTEVQSVYFNTQPLLHRARTLQLWDVNGYWFKYPAA